MGKEIISRIPYQLRYQLKKLTCYWCHKYVLWVLRFNSRSRKINVAILLRPGFMWSFRDQVLRARETEHPTQALTFTKSAGRQPGWGHCYLRSSALSSTLVLVKGAMFMLIRHRLKTRRKLDRVSFRKEFWDRYWGRDGQLLANLLVLSIITAPKVFAKVNSAQFLSRFNSRELKQQRLRRLGKRHLKGTVSLL